MTRVPIIIFSIRLYVHITYYFYSKSADFICTEHAPHEYCYWTVSIPPVSRDIACFPISTFNYSSSSEVKSNLTDVMVVDALSRKKSVVSRLSENNDNVIAVSRWWKWWVRMCNLGKSQWAKMRKKVHLGSTISCCLKD